MPDKVLIFPFGGNGREAANAICQLNKERPRYELIGFIDDNEAAQGQRSCGAEVLGGRNILKQYPQAKVLNVLGSHENYLKRAAIIKGLDIEDGRYITIAHPTAAIAEDVQLGHNCLVCAHVVISPGAKIGNHCIILPNTSIGHDTIIGDYTCVASNVALAGGVTVEQNCYIGAGSVVRNDLFIHEKSMIGCGANVIDDVAAGATVAGNPARTIKKEAA